LSKTEVFWNVALYVVKRAAQKKHCAYISSVKQPRARFTTSMKNKAKRTIETSVNIYHSTGPKNPRILIYLVTNLTLLLLLLLLRLLLPVLQWHYSALQSFASFMDFCQSPLFYYFSFQFVILHLLTSVCTQFHHYFFGPFSRRPENYC
jgi:hypothetical protein